MSNYATRTDLEKATGVDTDLDLDSLKAEIDNTYVDKLKIVDLSKLGKVVNNEVLKFRKKKIPDTGELVKRTDNNAKITEIEGKIPSITGLATTAALTTV